MCFPDCYTRQKGVCTALFWLSRLHTTSDEDDPKIKVYHFDEMINFHVQNFSILSHVIYTFGNAKIWSQMNMAVVIFIA